MREVADILHEAGIESAGAEARWIVQAATGMQHEDIVAGREVAELHQHRALRLASRRAAGEPLQYLTGLAGFRQLELEVGPGVFIPRPETEVVAGRAIELLPERGTLVDVGTGSGAIALAVATERPGARVYATERSPAAMAWAERNRDRLAPSVQLVQCNLFEGLPDELRAAVDVVVSNPPYVAATEEGMLAPEVRDHEPHEALFAGMEGLTVIERIAEDARGWLAPGGWLVMEIAERNGAAASRVLQRRGYEEVSLREDLAGRHRIAEGRRR